MMLLSDVDLGWRAHPEVWLVVASVIALGLYVTRVIAPKVPASRIGGQRAITPSQKAWFAAGVILLWIAADWPLHDLAEEYLYSLHMVQHTLLTLVIPPIFLLSIPSWLATLALPEGSKGWAVVSRLCRPVPAAAIFNGLMLMSHWAVVVNTSVQVALVHYSVHLVLVAGSFIMWIPICGPWKQLRLGPAGACVYLFVQSILPTVPGAFLTLSDSPIYGVYDHLPRLWGISVLEDQQFAGFFMKLGESAYLWSVIIFVFFRWAMAQERTDRRIHLVRAEDGIAFRLPGETAEAGAVVSQHDTFADDLERLGPAPAERTPS
jgi:putative membrane protein